MEYTREQAEQVMRDWNTFHLGSSDFTQSDDQFLDHKFPQLPERGWLKHEDGAIIFRTGKESGYGLNYGTWEIADNWDFVSYPREWQLATEEEVIAMLTEQAEKMGYVKGVKVKCISDGEVHTLDSFNEKAASLMSFGKIWFRSNNGYQACVMKDGKWAEIIADDLQERFDALVKEAKEKGKNVTVKFE